MSEEAQNIADDTYQFDHAVPFQMDENLTEELENEHQDTSFELQSDEYTEVVCLELEEPPPSQQVVEQPSKKRRSSTKVVEQTVDEHAEDVTVELEEPPHP